MIRTCEICVRTDELPHNDLVLATAPYWVELQMHLGCADEIHACPSCGPLIASPDGPGGEQLRDLILAHHRTGS